LRTGKNSMIIIRESPDLDKFIPVKQQGPLFRSLSDNHKLTAAFRAPRERWQREDNARTVRQI